jgi:NAD(P)-dependent dehydrogenase (short-subunit alcohol dehydrogenase family)
MISIIHAVTFETINERQSHENSKSIALVTGASSGIGKATAERLARAGYKVYGTSRRGARTGQRAFEMLPLDVTSDESVATAVNELIRLEGRIDLLVNNAGLAWPPVVRRRARSNRRGRSFETNFFGIIRMTRAVLPHMRKQRSGRIINIGSVLGSCRCRTERSMPRRSTQSKAIRVARP